MTARLRMWLYRKNMENFLQQQAVSKLHFRVIKLVLRMIESKAFNTRIIQESARLQVKELADIQYQKNEKGASFPLYDSLFRRLRFSSKEIWIIKGSIYAVEQVEHLFDVELRNIATQERLHIKQLFPLSSKDCTYHSNLSYDPPWLIQKRQESRNKIAIKNTTPFSKDLHPAQ